MPLKYKYLLIPDHQLAENLILFLVFTKGEQRDKSEFVSKFVENIIK